MLGTQWGPFKKCTHIPIYCTIMVNEQCQYTNAIYYWENNQNITRSKCNRNQDFLSLVVSQTNNMMCLNNSRNINFFIGWKHKNYSAIGAKYIYVSLNGNSASLGPKFDSSCANNGTKTIKWHIWSLEGSA